MHMPQPPIVFSDRHDRAVHGSVMSATMTALIELPKIFAESSYVLTIQAHRPYGATMHALECTVTDREWVHTNLEGFTGRVLYADSQS